ncbi:MAG: serine/threonine-protein kinase [Myxococcaceae bacterium]
MTSVSELTGKTIGGYRLERLIGEGAMGPVYDGVHRETGHQAAVKVIPSRHLASKSLLERFVNDQKALGKIHDPGIVAIADAGKVGDLGVYLVMEHLDGNPLSELLLAAQGGMLVQRALRITEGICAALEGAHEAGVLHRNLKPSNIFVVTQGKRVFVKLIDFGVNALGPAAGQHDYRAPEQVQSFPINEGADLWSVGAMLFEMLTDKKVSHGTDPIPAPSSLREGISPALDGLVLELLARFPEARPGSAKRIREACAQLRGDLPSESGMLPVVTAPPVADAEPALEIAAAGNADDFELVVDDAPPEPEPVPEPDDGARPPLAAMDSPLEAATKQSGPAKATGESEAVEQGSGLIKRLTGWMLGALALALLSSCGSEGYFNLACGNAGDCSSGQVCPVTGPMQGRCTKACSKDEQCSGLSSGHVVCSSDVCTPAP